jgi:hypothetical protein
MLGITEVLEFSIEWFVSPILLALVSVGFFLLNKPQKNLLKRVLASIHALLISLLYFTALFLWKSGTPPFADGAWYTWGILLAIGLIVYSFWGFTNKKRYHLLHLVTVFFGSYMYLYGAMMASNVWL